MADRLYLLNADWFDDQGGPWFCPPGARIEGVLGLYPRQREHLTVTHLDHPRPRFVERKSPRRHVFSHAHRGELAGGEFDRFEILPSLGLRLLERSDELVALHAGDLDFLQRHEFSFVDS